jgi:glycosyltransferase involved in cell wall biosynthesis
MANQCEQLARLLRAEGMVVEVVRTNEPYNPSWVGHLPFLRALVRLMPFLLVVWRGAGRAEVIHVLANSGWAWHLFAAPVIWTANLRRKPVIVNYRGGKAEEFLASAPRHVHVALHRAALRVTPSPFLERVFRRFGLEAEVIPNVIDLSRFVPNPRREFGAAPRLLVARHLEAIYGVETVLRSFAETRRRFPGAVLTVAGDGPQRTRLQKLAGELGIEKAVRFVGRVDNADMPALYADSDLVLNGSTVDNMPISLLEAFASGVPVVSTSAGGIPDIVQHDRTGVLVPPGDFQAMASATLSLLTDPQRATRLADAAVAEANRYAWSQVRSRWLDAYQRAVASAAS